MSEPPDYNDTFEMPGQHVYDGMVMPGIFKPEAFDKIKSFNFMDGDVVVASFPKAGTTWLQEIMYLIMNEADTNKAKEKDIYKRSPIMEMVLGDEIGVQYVENLPGTRILMTHVLPYFIEEKMRSVNMKVLYIIRNPKDTLVSTYHFYKMLAILGEYDASWDSFFNLYKSGKVWYGDWFDHVNAYWQKRHLPNLMIITYEELKYDLNKAVCQLAEFCQVSLTQEQIHTIVTHCSFKEMSKNPAANKDSITTKRGKFMRKGEIGDWKSYFNDEQNRFMESTYDSKLAEIGLRVTYE